MIRRDQYGRKITPQRPAGSKPAPAGHAPDKSPPQSPADALTPPTQPSQTAQPPAQPSGPQRHRFKTTQATPAQPSSRTPMWLVTVLLLLAAGGLTHGVWYFTHRPDPHFVKAREMVEDYETGRAVEMRNYTNTVYSGALAELQQVRPKSVSAEPARILQKRIEVEIRRFEEQRESERLQAAAAQDKRRARHASMQAARMRAVLNPVTEYPECEHEDAKSDGHKH